MIGKIIGAFVGDKLAKQTGSMGGATGAALGVVATTVLRRMSLPAMVVLGAGGYAVKKLIDKNEESKAAASDTNDNTSETAKTHSSKTTGKSDKSTGKAKPPKTSTAPAAA